MAERVQIQLDDACKGVKDDWGRTHMADDRREVTLPSYTAERLKQSGAVKSARRLYGGFSLPKQG